ncbi:MAG: hypothetical protein IPM29_28035 [Planctomycetes bacterium]|nr:hypothetical protein [Planctomycetota bacterium]
MADLVTSARNARWQLVDPRWTAGLFGGDGPPFGILYADFKRSTGEVREFIDIAPLLQFRRVSTTRFLGAYRLRGNAGDFTADITPKGHLELVFTGTRRLSCEARLRGINSDAKLALLTCVTNGTIVNSPGHSAIIADDTVYTFENLSGGVFSAASGWSVLKTTDYLKLPGNVKRPIVIQELSPSLVSAEKVLAYIHASIARDDDYLGSGVCSSQAASAIDAGVKGDFDPLGIDTPHSVWALARNRRIVTRTYVIWDSSYTPADKVAGMRQKLVDSYDDVQPASGQDVRSWVAP